MRLAESRKSSQISIKNLNLFTQIYFHLINIVFDVLSTERMIDKASLRIRKSWTLQMIQCLNDSEKLRVRDDSTILRYEIAMNDKGN